MFTNIISKLSFLGNELSAKWTVDEMIVDETIRTRATHMAKFLIGSVYGALFSSIELTQDVAIVIFYDCTCIFTRIG